MKTRPCGRFGALRSRERDERRMGPDRELQAEFFDCAAVPPQIQQLLDEWPDIDPATARLVRAAVMSRGSLPTS